MKEKIIEVYKELNGHLVNTAKKFPSLSKWSIRNILQKEGIYGKVKKPLTEEEKKRKKSLRVIEHRRRQKEILVEYKGGKCIRCNYNKCIEALEFHHRDPNEKDFAVTSFSYKMETLIKEVDKCDLVCSNCHKEIHFELKNTRA